MSEWNEFIKKFVDEISKSTGISREELLKKPDDNSATLASEMALYHQACMKSIEKIKYKIGKSIYLDWLTKQSK